MQSPYPGRKHQAMQSHKEAEQYLFNELRPVLRKFADLPVERLSQIGYQTSWHILEDHNTRREALSLFSKEFIWRKVHRWAEWWTQWHEGGRGCQFTKGQQLAGWKSGLKVRRDKANRRAYKAHLLRQRRYTMRQIAAKIGVSVGTVHTYLKKPWASLKRMFSFRSLTTCSTKDSNLSTGSTPSPSRLKTKQSFPHDPISPQKLSTQHNLRRE